MNKEGTRHSYRELTISLCDHRLELAVVPHDLERSV